MCTQDRLEDALEALAARNPALAADIDRRYGEQMDREDKGEGEADLEPLVAEAHEALGWGGE